jgi:hypothetical protein
MQIFSFVPRDVLPAAARGQPAPQVAEEKARQKLLDTEIARLEETVGRLRTNHRPTTGLYGEGEQFTHAAAAALEKVFILHARRKALEVQRRDNPAVHAHLHSVPNHMYDLDRADDDDPALMIEAGNGAARASLVLDDLNALELRQGLADGTADQKAGLERQDPLESRPPG